MSRAAGHDTILSPTWLSRLFPHQSFLWWQSIVLTRELQQLLKTREAFVKKRRDFIQDALNTRLQQLP